MFWVSGLVQLLCMQTLPCFGFRVSGVGSQTWDLCSAVLEVSRGRRSPHARRSCSPGSTCTCMHAHPSTPPSELRTPGAPPNPTAAMQLPIDPAFSLMQVHQSVGAREHHATLEHAVVLMVSSCADAFSLAHSHAMRMHACCDLRFALMRLLPPSLLLLFAPLQRLHTPKDMTRMTRCPRTQGQGHHLLKHVQDIPVMP